MNSKRSQHYIYYLRHAECVGNLAEDKFPKETDGLTETGKEQVKLVATVLPDMDYIYSSNFRRAVDTADGILAHHKERGNVIDGPTVEMVEILRERDCGDLAAFRWDSAQWKAKFGELKTGKKFYQLEFPGSSATSAEFLEGQKQFLKGVIKILRTDSASKKLSNVLIVTHCMNLKSVMEAVMDGNFSDFVTLSHPPIPNFPWALKNTAFTKVGVDFNSEDGDKVVLTFDEVDNTKHLDVLA